MSAKTYFRSKDVIKANNTPATLDFALFSTAQAAVDRVIGYNESRMGDAVYTKVLIEEIVGHPYTFKKVFVPDNTPSPPEMVEVWVAEEEVDETVPEMGVAPPTTTTMYRVCQKTRMWNGSPVVDAYVGKPKTTLQACLDEIISLNEEDSDKQYHHAIIEEFQTFERLIPVPAIPGPE